MLFIVISMLIAYILGSVPSSLWTGLLIKKIDIRQFGSGNVGATNAVRVLGAKIGIPVLIFDIFKGWISLYIGNLLLTSNNVEVTPIILILIGMAAICGHIFTIFLKFKGGKGVATSAGVFLFLTPIPFIVAFLVFFSVVFSTRYVSLGSILASLGILIAQIIQVFYFGKSEIEYLVLIALVAIFIIVRHKSNIKRLIAGNENKFGAKKQNK